MPYGDKDKQKLYQKLYYEKYIKKPNTKVKNLKIDLINYKPTPLGVVHNPTLNHIPIPLKFEYDPYMDAEKLDTLSLEKGKVIDILDRYGNLKTNKQLRTESMPPKNKTIKQVINLYETDKSEYIHDIPIWIRNMTDATIKIKVDELCKCLKDTDIDYIIERGNKLFGTHKSRLKLDYVYNEMVNTLIH